MAEVALPEPLPPTTGIDGLRARLPRWEPAILLWLLLVAVLLLLVINPLLRLLITSFQETDTQFFTLANYGLAFGRLRNVTALLNSLLYGAAVTLVSICFAVPTITCSTWPFRLRSTPIWRPVSWLSSDNCRASSGDTIWSCATLRVDSFSILRS